MNNLSLTLAGILALACPQPSGAMGLQGALKPFIHSRTEWRAENAQNEWSDQPRAVHFFPDGSSEFLQLDLRGQRDRHVQVALDPLTARARVGQIYQGSPVEGAQPEVQPEVRPEGQP